MKRVTLYPIVDHILTYMNQVKVYRIDLLVPLDQLSMTTIMWNMNKTLIRRRLQCENKVINGR